MSGTELFFCGLGLGFTLGILVTLRVYKKCRRLDFASKNNSRPSASSIAHDRGIEIFDD